jgi:hypothetical protein
MSSPKTVILVNNLNGLSQPRKEIHTTKTHRTQRICKRFQGFTQNITKSQSPNPKS